MKAVGLLIISLLLLTGCSQADEVDPLPTMTSSPEVKNRRVLVFSKTAGFRHDSIEEGIEVFRLIADELGLRVDATEDPSGFSLEALKEVGVVIFLNTTGDVLEPSQQEAMEKYIRNGGAFIGVHSASDTEYDWSWYGGLVGAYFKSHPPIQTADVKIVDRKHPLTEGLPEYWTRTDEWYNFRVVPSQVHVLAHVEEIDYQGGEHGGTHPILWCHEYDGGRSFYTAGGHTEGSFGEAYFRHHLRAAIQWAVGLKQADC